MNISGQEVLDELWNIYMKCNSDTAAIYEIHKEDLSKFTDYERLYLKGKMSILIKDGFLARYAPPCDAIPFSCVFTAQGIKAINDRIASNSEQRCQRGVPYL